MKQKGFTLVELMVTIVVLALVLTVGVPSFQSMIVSNSVTADRDILFNALIYARGEAVNRGEMVTVCKSSDLADCSTTTSWGNGWIVFIDEDDDGSVDTGETILRVGEALDASVSASTSPSVDRVTFTSRGQLSGSSTATTFTFSHSSGTSYDKSVGVSSTGRASRG
ncbi:GspH/FimT family pseudopilin [Hahella ganghwensis]|uniref:GspH/FimT family pseudopilin n=1 Tax=Hahella ganghwensis TaxID=286420 RepID=UPI0003645FDB|nr:GspH/FimT family pseudopilin [Hahella ganghwensis]